MPSWFDLLTLDASGPEDEAGIKKVGNHPFPRIMHCPLTGSGMFIAYPRCIPDPTTAKKEGGGGNKFFFLPVTFYVASNFTKLKNILILNK